MPYILQFSYAFVITSFSFSI